MYSEMLDYIDKTFTGEFTDIDDIAFKKLKYQTLFYGMLTNTVGNIFDFEELPDIDEIDLKRCYLYNHYVGYDTDIDRFVPLAPEGSSNVYQEYTEFTNKIGDTKKKFTVWSNTHIVGFNKSFYSVSTAFICYTYACRLAELIISIDNAVIASRILNVFVGNENQKNELKTMFEFINLGKPYMITEEFNENNTAKILQFQKPEEINKFYDAFRDIVNEFLMICGLSSLTNPQKKERLVVDEATSTADIKSVLINDMYQNRKAFLDKINAAKGTNYKVRININTEDIERLMDPESFIEIKEGGKEDV